MVRRVWWWLPLRVQWILTSKGPGGDLQGDFLNIHGIYTLRFSVLYRVMLCFYFVIFKKKRKNVSLRNSNVPQMWEPQTLSSWRVGSCLCFFNQMLYVRPHLPTGLTASLATRGMLDAPKYHQAEPYDGDLSLKHRIPSCSDPWSFIFSTPPEKFSL